MTSEHLFSVMYQYVFAWRFFFVKHLLCFDLPLPFSVVFRTQCHFFNTRKWLIKIKCSFALVCHVFFTITCCEHRFEGSTRSTCIHDTLSWTFYNVSLRYKFLEAFYVYAIQFFATRIYWSCHVLHRSFCFKFPCRYDACWAATTAASVTLCGRHPWHHPSLSSYLHLRLYFTTVIPLTLMVRVFQAIYAYFFMLPL